jgi:hypothetical protein
LYLRQFLRCVIPKYRRKRYQYNNSIVSYQTRHRHFYHLWKYNILIALWRRKKKKRKERKQTACAWNHFLHKARVQCVITRFTLIFSINLGKNIYLIIIVYCGSRTCINNPQRNYPMSEPTLELSCQHILSFCLFWKVISTSFSFSFLFFLKGTLMPFLFSYRQ